MAQAEAICFLTRNCSCRATVEQIYCKSLKNPVSPINVGFGTSAEAFFPKPHVTVVEESEPRETWSSCCLLCHKWQSPLWYRNLLFLESMKLGYASECLFPQNSQGFPSRNPCEWVSGRELGQEGRTLIKDQWPYKWHCTELLHLLSLLSHLEITDVFEPGSRLILATKSANVIVLAHLILTTIFLRFYLFVIYVYKYLPECIHMHHVCVVLMEARRRRKRSPWN